MKKVKQFDKANLKMLRVEMNKELQSVAKKYGITIDVGNASFSSNEVTFKVNANTVESDGTVITKESQSWDRHKGFYNLSHLNVGDTITIQGSPYTLSGFNTRARKAPVNFKNSAGAGYKCSVRMLQMENSK